MHQRENHLSFSMKLTQKMKGWLSAPLTFFWMDIPANIDDLYDGAIEITPIPTVEEFNSHVWGEEFHACLMEKAEFERIWESHIYDGGINVIQEEIL